MSVAGYIGRNIREPRIPVELLKEKTLEEAGRETPEVEPDRYQSVANYDPVLRAHCRL